jgi:ABC-type phosphate/phosphonate transport system substrate-binding protein
MIASLPMYDWAELAPSHDAFWTQVHRALADAGLPAPANLDRDIGLWEAWEHPDLLLGQTCGMPYRTRLHGHVHLVGTLDYGLPDAPPGYYYSELVVRADETASLSELIERRLAFNGQDSQSGWAAPQNFVAQQGARFKNTLHSGAHRESARAVAEGRADIAALDAVTWRLITRYLPDVASGLRVIARTDPTPGLPLITARTRDTGPIAAAVETAIAKLAESTRLALGLQGLVTIPASAYMAIPIPPPPSQDTPQN